MNTTKQFWTLLRFQTTNYAFFWIMPVAFGLPLYMPWLITSSLAETYHPDFYSLFSNQNCILIGIFGTMILAPERFQFGAANKITNYSGSEFLLTRAVDRPVLYRAKATVLYLLALALPLVAFICSLHHPDLIVEEYSKPVQQACLSEVPGSTLIPAATPKGAPHLISIPRGNLTVAAWQFLTMAGAAIGLQLLILSLYPVKYARIIFWALLIGLFSGSFYVDLHSIGKHVPSAHEQLFFFFAAHQTAFWCSLAAGIVLCQLWCERRFARLEQ